jgi:hypothetical protein
MGVAGSCEMLETNSKKTVNYHIPKNSFHTWICGFSQFIFEDMDLLLLLSLVTLANDQLDAQIFNTFITILYMYMFRAISCSS